MSLLVRIHRANRLRVPIYMFIKAESSFEKYRLSNEEWSFLDHIQSILQPIDDATYFLSVSKYPPISSVILVYSDCLEEIQAVGVPKSLVVNTQVAIEGKFNEYYQTALKKNFMRQLLFLTHVSKLTF